MHIYFGDANAQYRLIKKEVDAAIKRVLDSGWFILGKEVLAFEKAFAYFCGVKYCIGVANGMEALQIALIASGVKQGDEVITTPLTAAATSLAIIHIGAIPVYVDIDPTTFTIDPKKIDKVITNKTKAILPVHLYGRMADMRKINTVARKHNLVVIEDCAQAHGASIGNKKAGAWGICGAFSFYPSKNLGAFGDGGCITTNNKQIANYAKSLRDYGQTGRYQHDYIGLNSRLDELQAAILTIKLRKLEKWNARRQILSHLYSTLLNNVPIILPELGTKKENVCHLYVIRTQKQNKLRKFLATRGIETQVHYPMVLYQQKALNGYAQNQCAIAEALVREIISLPMYPELSKKNIQSVCLAIKEFFSYET